jgi:hypothetical protein
LHHSRGVPKQTSDHTEMLMAGLAVRLCPHTRAMTEDEIRQRVKEILLKRVLGNDRSSQEERILAYAHYAAGEQAVRMWVGAETEIGE